MIIDIEFVMIITYNTTKLCLITFSSSLDMLLTCFLLSPCILFVGPLLSQVEESKSTLTDAVLWTRKNTWDPLLKIVNIVEKIDCKKVNFVSTLAPLVSKFLHQKSKNEKSWCEEKVRFIQSSKNTSFFNSIGLYRYYRQIFRSR